MSLDLPGELHGEDRGLHKEFSSWTVLLVNQEKSGLSSFQSSRLTSAIVASWQEQLEMLGNSYERFIGKIVFLLPGFHTPVSQCCLPELSYATSCYLVCADLTYRG